MKNLLLAFTVVIATVSLGLGPGDAEARRLGGGRPAGMQRQAPPANAAPTAPTATPNAPAAAPTAQPGGAATAAAPGQRSWMGPLAGLAAGVGLAALFSHFGMGAGLANFVMLALLAFAAFALVRFVIGRRGSSTVRSDGPQLAGAGAPMPGPSEVWPGQPGNSGAPTLQRSALDVPAAPGATPAAVSTVPGGMAAADFERLAKMVFIRMQAANDAGNVDDLRKFTTPELFASLRLDLQDRGGARQQTDVVHIEAQVLEVAEEKGQDIVSVRFRGLIRETPEAGAEPFTELWHLVRPADSEADWAIAGITPVQ